MRQRIRKRTFRLSVAADNASTSFVVKGSITLIPRRLRPAKATSKKDSRSSASKKQLLDRWMALTAFRSGHSRPGRWRRGSQIGQGNAAVFVSVVTSTPAAPTIAVYAAAAAILVIFADAAQRSVVIIILKKRSRCRLQNIDCRISWRCRFARPGKFVTTRTVRFRSTTGICKDENVRIGTTEKQRASDKFGSNQIVDMASKRRIANAPILRMTF